MATETNKRDITMKMPDQGEESFRNVFRYATIGMALTDFHGRFLQINSAFCALSGYSAEELLQMDFLSITHPDDRETNAKLRKDLLAGNIPAFVLEKRYVKKSGDIFWAQISVSPVRDQEGNLLHTVALIQDITARKQAEARVDYLAHLTEEIADAIISIDLNYIIESWNRGAESIYSWKAEEVVGKSLLEIVPSTFLTGSREECLQALATQGFWKGEVIQHAKDGTPIYILGTTSIITDQSGAIIGSVAINRDITEQKEAERVRRRLAAIVESSNDAIVGLTLEGFITSWNGAAERMFGYSEQETVGKHITLIIPEALQQEEVEILEKLRQGSRIQHYEAVRLRKDGRPTDVSLSISPIRDRAGTIIGAAKIARDITERKEFERRKDEFIAMASHELKTPLTSLNGFLQLLDRHIRKQKDEQGNTIMKRVNREVNRLIKLVADLLDISKIQTGQLEYQEEPFDLDALVQEIVEMVQAGTASHRICVEGQACAAVFADKGRIGQVLMNLLTNAIKYSPQASMVIVRLSADQENARVSVQDFGDGIAKEYQQKIFERYYQVSDSNNQPFAGLGMGLYLANEIIKRHRGSIGVESTQGQGSIFSFTLPVQAYSF
jgi:PAS domain S-box-containing protein